MSEQKPKNQGTCDHMYAHYDEVGDFVCGDCGGYLEPEEWEGDA